MKKHINAIIIFIGLVILSIGVITLVKVSGIELDKKVSAQLIEIDNIVEMIEYYGFDVEIGSERQRNFVYITMDDLYIGRHTVGRKGDSKYKINKKTIEVLNQAHSNIGYFHYIWIYKTLSTKN